VEGVLTNEQQPEHATIVRIDNVRFGEDEYKDRVKIMCTEVVGEYAGTELAFWCNRKNVDGKLSPAMKLYALLTAGHGKGWTSKFKDLDTAIKALRGKYVAADSVKKDETKGGIGNNVKDGTIQAVPEDFEPAI